MYLQFLSNTAIQQVLEAYRRSVEEDRDDTQGAVSTHSDETLSLHKFHGQITLSPWLCNLDRWNVDTRQTVHKLDKGSLCLHRITALNTAIFSHSSQSYSVCHQSFH